jgi:hypothetical protein
MAIRYLRYAGTLTELRDQVNKLGTVKNGVWVYPEGGAELINRLKRADRAHRRKEMAHRTLINEESTFGYLIRASISKLTKDMTLEHLRAFHDRIYEAERSWWRESQEREELKATVEAFVRAHKQ